MIGSKETFRVITVTRVNYSDGKHRQRLSQGRVLSPLLWSDLLAKQSAEGYNYLGYADDIAIVVRGKYAKTIKDHTQGALNLVSNWCSRHGLTVRKLQQPPSQGNQHWID